MKTKLLLNETNVFQVLLFIAFFSFTSNNNLCAQSFINNGNFSAGIETDWEHRIKPGNTPFTEETGVLNATIGIAPAGWWETGIISLKKDNTFAIGETVKVTFTLETTEVNAKVKCVLYTPELDVDNPQYSNPIDVQLKVGSHQYTAYITNSTVTRSNYEFNFFFLNSGTFKVDNIEVAIVDFGSNLTAIASVVTDAPDGNISLIKDGDQSPWSGWAATAIDPANPVSYWVEFNWGTAQTLNSAILYTNSSPDYAVNGYTVQYWDGTSYLNLDVVSDNTSQIIISSFSSITTEKMRFIFTQPDVASSHYRVEEIEIYNNTTMAVDDVASLEDNFFVYTKPNNIVVTAKESIKQLQIYSLLGTVVYDQKNLGNNGSFNIASDESAKGIYVVRINSKYAKKIIVQ